MDVIPPSPDHQTLREAALAHLARFATTRQNLKQMLQRRVRRWGVRAVRAGMFAEDAAMHEEACQPLIEQIVDEMEQLGAVDDAGFSRSRARNLARSGRSRRAVQAHLQAKGVDGETVRQAVDESLGEAGDERARQAELAAALVLARKRTVGPFHRPDRPEKDRMKVLAIFARNGFSQDVATKALEMDREEAEDLIIEFRSL
ncbi:RecX family transcriptional regulator [Bombella sp. TMW 2.2559]|uniref:Regulatory protein RecX n=1 Tax=Bombella dulcis TaxID=2967339 RepID=A0ABT3WDX0_9PROT|nr:RecX family transcriptional regulator [Bombella dulcis]MCX5616564.1 RecX family transcriptional regulator [Bombella dulcis]